MAKEKKEHPRSFMVSDAGEGGTFGDLLSSDRIESGEKIKVGLFTTGNFEFWHQYPELEEQVHADAKIVYDRLSKKHDIVYSGVVDTMDSVDEAGRKFRDAAIDMLILDYRTYLPDAYVHHMLSYIPRDVPLLFFASQQRDGLDYETNYGGSYRNQGSLAEVQLVGGIRKMGVYKNRLEVIAGTIYEDRAYERIDRYIDVVTIWKRLKRMTIGLIGNVFRGMFDFEYDRTKVKGTLGPEIISVSVDHLLKGFEKATLDDPDVKAFIKHTHESYVIEGVDDDEIAKASRLGVALKRLVERFRLDGLSLLGQHHVERILGVEPFLGMNELNRAGFPTTSEGDVIGLIVMKILHHLTGNMAFHLEWTEFISEYNCLVMLGHGFGDPNQARNGIAKLTPAAEPWDVEGTGVCSLFAPEPGPCTMAHFIEDADGWRMNLSTGEILDLEPLPINEVHAFIRMGLPIREFVEKLIKAGVPHHAITVRGDVSRELRQLADLMGMPVITL